MYNAYQKFLADELTGIRASGLYKSERVLTTPQNAHVGVPDQPAVLNMCANNYLGLADHPRLIAAAHRALDRWGGGLASVRFICGTQAIHKQLERKIADFLGCDDAILYSSCFDANGGLFETLLGSADAIISDELNHASIIDGVRLCKAQRLRYRNSDLTDLEAKLRESSGARFRMIATDGVFSMDGTIANLPGICDLADRYDALVMVDDSHATGVLGRHGRGTHEHHGVMRRVDILTGTLGKALGGATGGYTAARAEIVELLRQRSRPYLFSNSVAPAVVAAGMEAIDMLSESTDLRDRLADNASWFRAELTTRGFNIVPGEHPIVPIMLGDASLAGRMAQRLLERGVYAIGFSYPVVPHGKARIRVQVSAAHSREDLMQAVDAFAAVRDELEL